MTKLERRKDRRQKLLTDTVSVHSDEQRERKMGEPGVLVMIWIWERGTMMIGILGGRKVPPKSVSQDPGRSLVEDGLGAYNIRGMRRLAFPVELPAFTEECQ